jgi:hypothetical protein
MGSNALETIVLPLIQGLGIDFTGVAVVWGIVTWSIRLWLWIDLIRKTGRFNLMQVILATATGRGVERLPVDRGSSFGPRV